MGHPPVLLSTLFLLTVFASSQGTAQSVHPSSNQDGRYEVFAGYSYLSDSFNEHDTAPSHRPMSGWDVAIGARLVRGLSVKLDVSGYIGSNYSDPQRPVFILGGGQYALHLNRVTPFVEVLAGLGHLNKDWFPGQVTTSSFTAASGGGFDIALTRRLAFRAQGGILHTHFTIASNQIHGLPTNFGRLSIGAVAHF